MPSSALFGRNKRRIVAIELPGKEEQYSKNTSLSKNENHKVSSDFSATAASDTKSNEVDTITLRSDCAVRMEDIDEDSDDDDDDDDAVSSPIEKELTEKRKKNDSNNRKSKFILPRVKEKAAGRSKKPPRRIQKQPRRKRRSPGRRPLKPEAVKKSSLKKVTKYRNIKIPEEEKREEFNEEITKVMESFNNNYNELDENSIIADNSTIEEINEEDTVQSSVRLNRVRSGDYSTASWISDSTLMRIIFGSNASITTAKRSNVAANKKKRSTFSRHSRGSISSLEIMEEESPKDNFDGGLSPLSENTYENSNININNETIDINKNKMVRQRNNNNNNKDDNKNSNNNNKDNDIENNVDDNNSNDDGSFSTKEEVASVHYNNQRGLEARLITNANNKTGFCTWIRNSPPWIKAMFLLFLSLIVISLMLMGFAAFLHF